MNTKEIFEAPEIEVISITSADIITTSGNEGEWDIQDD